MLAVFKATIRHDLAVHLRNRSSWLLPMVFFTIFISLFGIGLGFDTQQLLNVSPAIIWIAFLLTSLFTIESIFRSDKEEGVLEQLLISPYPLWWLLLAKALSLWIAACLPLICMIPLLGLFMQLPSESIMMLILSLLLGSPAMILLGMVGASLTIMLERAGMMLALLLLPLYIPLLILGESTISAILLSQKPIFQLSLLGALSVLAVTLAPLAAAGAMRVSIE